MIAVVGPTASGKSEWAMALARSLGGDLVNADAFQLYRGMDIGTAKPSLAERSEVPHHCIDLLDIAQPATVAWFQRVARTAAVDIAARGRIPIIVGGSPLYVRAVCDHLDIPPSDPSVRRRLQDRADAEGAAAMHRELADRDPDAAAAIDPRNIRRVIRALEVVELTGSFTARLPQPRPWRPTWWVAPQWERAELDVRIAERTRRMWRAGLRDEVLELSRRGLVDAPTASRAVGYPQALAELRGECGEDEAISATVAATRRLARRQERTFRADPRVRWFPGAGGAPVGAAREFLSTDPAVVLRAEDGPEQRPGQPQ